jgi:hypothetical protein
MGVMTAITSAPRRGTCIASLQFFVGQSDRIKIAWILLNIVGASVKIGATATIQFFQFILSELAARE